MSFWLHAGYTGESDGSKEGRKGVSDHSNRPNSEPARIFSRTETVVSDERRFSP
jgi:hypothetical protein